MPSYFAILPGDLRRYLHKHYLPMELDIMWAPLLVVSGNIYVERAQNYCIEHGYVKILSALHHRDFTYKQGYSLAAKHRQLAVIQWLVSKGIEKADSGKTMHEAVLTKQDEVFKWCFDHGFMVSTDTINTIARQGNLSLAQWFWQHERTILYEAQWSENKSRSSPYFLCQRTLAEAVKSGNVAFVAWLLTLGDFHTHHKPRQ